MIWHRIQTAEKEEKNLHAVFLNLACALKSVPQFPLAVFGLFSDKANNQKTLSSPISKICSSSSPCLAFTTAWHHLEIDIMAKCTISPLAFTMAIEVIKWVIGGEHLTPGNCLPPIRAFMDDLKTITTTAPCTRRLLEKLQENISAARMKFKPSKSRNISIVKGKLAEQRFYINQEPIPSVSEKPIKRLGRWYNSKVNESDQIYQM